MIKIERFIHCNELLKKIALIALRKDVYNELGYPIFSEENHVWYLIYSDHQLIGFCSMVYHKNYVSFNHDYILPDFRNNGFYNKLFKYRFENTGNVLIKAVATEKSINTFVKYGFEILKKTKNYIFVQLNKENGISNFIVENAS